MTDIVRIVIKGESGFFCFEEAYTDKVILTERSISYEYTPRQETEINTKRKWSYKTNSPIFKMKYDEVADMLPAVIASDNSLLCCDVGGIEFDVTYSDKKKVKKIFFVGSDQFKVLFAVIKQLVPQTEYTPAVLITSDDYEEEENN